MNISIKKLIICLIFISFLISIYNSYLTIIKHDNLIKTSEGIYQHQLIKFDNQEIWIKANDFKKNLTNKDYFFESIPVYERFFLPIIYTGLYFYFINKDIIDDNNNFNVNNGKFGLLFVQNLIFFLSVLYFFFKISQNLSCVRSAIIIIFVVLEPSISQYHSSFWSESLYLSMLLILCGMLININQNKIKNFLIGIILALMFTQRTISIGLIIPVLIFVILRLKKKSIQPIFCILFTFGLILFLIGVNNFKKTSNFFILSYQHRYWSFYHYMAHELTADRLKITKEEAYKNKINNEHIWKKNNLINEERLQDLFKIIEYRNKIFLHEVYKNPIYTLKYISWKTLQMLIIEPSWVKKNIYLDKNNKEEIKKVSKDGIKTRIIYSSGIYIITLIGFIKFFLNIKKNKYIINKNEAFYIFLLIVSIYFTLSSGWLGNPRYLVPCMITIAVFFSEGTLFLINRTKR
jgi:hypothetical protein